MSILVFPFHSNLCSHAKQACRNGRPRDYLDIHLNARLFRFTLLYFDSCFELKTCYISASD